MAVTIHFRHVGFTTAKYDDAINQLEDAGAAAPEGREYHVCHGDPENLEVTDVWDSIEHFQEFAKTIVPILESLGLEPGSPEVTEVRNVIYGEYKGDTDEQPEED